MDKKDILIDQVNAGARILTVRGQLYSVWPPETMFGYVYHGNMIPPFRPEHTLILGYGEGTIAGLMRKIWGTNLKITGVDNTQHETHWNEYEIIYADAFEYVKSCTDSMFKKKFDYIVIDLHNENGCPEFVYDVEFVVRIKEMTKGIVCINFPLSEISHAEVWRYYGGYIQDRIIPCDDRAIVFLGTNHDDAK